MNLVFKVVVGGCVGSHLGRGRCGVFLGGGGVGGGGGGSGDECDGGKGLWMGQSPSRILPIRREVCGRPGGGGAGS